MFKIILILNRHFRQDQLFFNSTIVATIQYNEVIIKFSKRFNEFYFF